MTMTTRSCPRCSAILPFWRWPRTLRQALFGGWTCPTCGAEVDRVGRLRATR